MTDVLERLRSRIPSWPRDDRKFHISVLCEDVHEAMVEIETLRDKCGGLSEDLISAVGAAYNHGAVSWVKLNYPDFPAIDHDRDGQSDVPEAYEFHPKTIEIIWEGEDAELRVLRAIFAVLERVKDEGLDQVALCRVTDYVSARFPPPVEPALDEEQFR